MDAPDKRRVHVATFGCRVNQADSEGILATLAAKDMVPAPTHVGADLVVINSCTVTHRSDADIRKLVSRVHRENPAAKIVVAGCYAQRDPASVAALSGVSGVLGNSDAPRLGELVDLVLGGEAQVVLRTAFEALDGDALPPVDPVAVVHDRTRPFVKIQDGCDAACTYCIIPDTRGPARSAPPDGVVGAVERLVRQGYFEVVIAGVHLGTYAGGLDALIRRVLEVPGLGRLRVSCVEPMAFPLALADLAREDRRLAPHFHLPLQAGSDAVLKRMARPYRAKDYLDTLREIRARLPGVCLGTDVIVGFPGESDADFEETCRVVEAAGLAYVHVFSYSDRPGAPSTRLRGKVDPRVVKARATRLNAIGASLWARWLDAQVGRTLEAITLDREGEVIEALSEEYCPIKVRDAGLARGIPVKLRVTHREGDTLWGARRLAVV